MTDYKATATANQWAHEEHWATESSTAACILELRARVKNIEENLSFTVEAVSSIEDSVLELQEKVHILADFADQIISKSYSKSTPNDRQIRSSDHFGDINKMVNLSAGLTSSNYPAKPDSSLVKRVALAISGIEYGLELDEEAVNWASEARAAIREVAEWMKEQERRGIVDLPEALEQEADRG